MSAALPFIANLGFILFYNNTSNNNNDNNIRKKSCNEAIRWGQVVASQYAIYSSSRKMQEFADIIGKEG